MQHTDGLINSLAEPVFWIAAAICVVAELAILRAGFVPHAGNEDPAVPHASRGLEMLWTVLPAIMLAILLAATWRAVHH